jgi:serine/threonine protein kinase
MTDAATLSSDLQKGSLLGGKYRLEREIGRGAMGTVWSAIHESLQQRVAVKIISPEHAGSDELRKRFDTEARAAAKLRSRFVVAVSDNGLTPQGVPYIVMEYLEGECLEDRIARAGCLSLRETARVARHVSRALSRAHARGIIHRDLKPANIFLTKSDDDDDLNDWTAKVLDFGIAKMDDFSENSTTKTGAVLGTPLFMSPEQVRGASSVDHRADLYSFGMVIYNMLTGTYAFEGQSFGDLLVSICTDPLPRLSQSAPHIPAELDRWFQKACARDPSERYATASDLMDAFAESLGEAPSLARLSMSDITSTSESGITMAHMAQAAKTLAASSGNDAGISHVDTGASAHTLHEAPKKSRLLPLFGAAILVVGAGVAFSLLTTKSAPLEAAVPPTAAEPQDPSTEQAGAVVQDDQAEPAVKLDEKPHKEPSPGTAEATQPSDDLGSVESDTSHPVVEVPPKTKPPRPTQPRPGAPVEATPSANEQPAPTPASSRPAVPDLGF